MRAVRARDAALVLAVAAILAASAYLGITARTDPGRQYPEPVVTSHA